MHPYEWWGLIALALGIAELLTGTFYLLVLAAACLGGAGAAWAGAGLTVQFVVTAALSVLGWAALQRWHPARSRRLAPTADPDVVLDIGEHVHVDSWDDAGSTQVSYRGARWQARYDPQALGPGRVPQPGPHRIGAVDGNRLILTPVAEAAPVPPTSELR
jgi:membrane protein implicated in regulation of membrane protease activity